MAGGVRGPSGTGAAWAAGIEAWSMRDTSESETWGEPPGALS
jgi:hypothetical protein